MAYQKTVIDSIGNVHERKNRYLYDLAVAQETGGKKPDKSTHPYEIKYRAYKDAEKKFLEKLKGEVAAYKPDDEHLLKLKKMAFAAEKKRDFYKDYIDLDYTAELLYLENVQRAEQIPEALREDERLRTELKETEAALEEAKKLDRTEIDATIETLSEERKARYEESLRSIKKSKDDKLISLKAYRNEMRMAKLSLKEDLLGIEVTHDPVLALTQKRDTLKHRVKMELKTRKKVLYADIADLRRKIPIEVHKDRPVFAIPTAILPGLGQFLNKQYMKALLFFIGSLFIYLIAIPYALGYGNYQGQGLAGLVSLANGGLKIHRSMIFMIEGIIAIFLLLIAAGIFIFSYKDVRSVEKNEIQGVRKNLWFETRAIIDEKGFPILVSAPSFILILFVVLVPIMTTVLLSFTNMDPTHQNKFSWVGFQNYANVAMGKGVAGGPFWLILGWTLIWTLCATTLAIFIGFLFALLVNNDRVKFKRFWRTVFLLPWAVPAFITIMFFSIMLAPGGPLTEILTSITGQTMNVKADTAMTRTALILLQGWLGSAYVFLISTGVLQGIPSDLYEAAEIDGATGFQRTMKITIPLVLFQTAPLLVGQYTFNFNNFSIIYLFNQGGPFNPSLYGNMAGSSDLLISYIYKLTIENQYQSIGAAITIVISIVLMIFSYIGFKNSKAFKEG